MITKKIKSGIPGKTALREKRRGQAWALKGWTEGRERFFRMREIGLCQRSLAVNPKI